MRGHLFTVVDAIEVGIAYQRVGRIGINLLAVTERVAVGVIEQRIGTCRHLIHIGESITVVIFVTDIAEGITVGVELILIAVIDTVIGEIGYRIAV